MSIATITFGCGTEVQLEQIAMSPTYYGCFLGGYSKERSDRILQRSAKDAHRIFQYAESHLVPPNSMVKLPQFRGIAELGANEPCHDPGFMCSYCVLIWFQDNLPGTPEANVSEVARRLSWADVAIDSSY